MIEGIDVSSENGPVNWSLVKAAGATFAYHRADIGLGTRDDRLTLNAIECDAVELEHGVYGLPYPRFGGRKQDAVAQARELAAMHREVGATLDPMVDVEPAKDNRVASGAEWLEAVRLYVATLEEELGVAPFIYTTPAWWDSIPELASALDLTRCPLWVADYRGNAEPWVPKPWKSWTVWQWAAGAGTFGRISGVRGFVDRNRLAAGKTLDDIRIGALLAKKSA